MTTGVEFIDLIAGAMTLAFILKLLFVSDEPIDLSPSGNREKLSLLNQHIAPKIRTA